MVKDKDTVLVVPTIRKDCIHNFLRRWMEIGLHHECDIIIMEDNPDKTFNIHDVVKTIDEDATDQVTHLCWKDIENSFSRQCDWIIPRRSDTVRSYGYWYAWQLSKAYKYILTLDDDCYPPTVENDGLEYKTAADFIDLHKKMLTKRSKWYSTLNDVKPRGIPFYNVGIRDDIIVNHGLWTNVLDYDAPTQLVNPIPEKFDFKSTVVPAGSFFPMCGMNVMWKADYTVWMYHLLMGSEIRYSDNGLEPTTHPFPFDRFGDIWCGIIMKKLADIKRVSVSTGIPYIRHERASNPFTNLKKEVNGLEVNEKFWDYIDRYYHEDPMSLTDIQLYEDMGHYVSLYLEFPQYETYFKKLGEAMQIWSGMFV